MTALTTTNYCPVCHSDLTPDHCGGMYDAESGYEASPLDWHQSRCGPGFCVCPCGDCAPDCGCWHEDFDA